MTTTSTQKWLDEMIIELRLRDVRGTAIGDAAAQVEAHCAETGETPEEAFGDPREYARSLDFPASALQPTHPVDWAKTLAPVAAGLVAVNLEGPTVRAALNHTGVWFTWGWLAALAVMALGVLLTVRIIGALLQNRINLALYFGGLIAATTALGILWRDKAFSAPLWATAALIVVLLAASVIGIHKMQAFDDPLVDPRRPEERVGKGMQIATTWLFVIITVGLAVIDCIALLMR